MKLRNFTKKKVMAFGLAFGVAAGAGGIAAAYFSASGSGSGTALAGHATNLTIRQVGAGYNSIIASNGNTYTASLCYVCQHNTEIGDAVALPYGTPKYTTGYSHVTSVTAALVNFGAERTLPVTLTLYGSPNVASYTFTKTFHINPGTATNQVVTDVTFTLAGTHVFVNAKTATHFMYGIALTRTHTSGVNIALAHRQHQLTVGSSPATTVWIANSSKTTTTFKTTTFAATTSWTTGLIPAVQINVIGGVVPPLYPGAPAQHVQYAITNPNPGSLHVSTITTAVKTSGATVTGASSGCLATWFPLAHNPYPYKSNVSPGTTIVTGTTTIHMMTSGGTQDACVGASVPLTFSSN